MRLPFAVSFTTSYPAPQPHPKRRRVARAVEPARTDPAHIAEADILLDVLASVRLHLRTTTGYFSERTFATWRRASTNLIRRSTQVASPTQAIMVDQIPVPIAPATRGSA